jgi:Lon protease-like protein
MDEPAEIPLFPINTVLFPGGLLPLRIFEARYLDMISECLRDDKGFGLCAIRSGGAVGQAALCYPVGTLAKVQDFSRGDDGLLQVVATGKRRFRVVGQHTEPNQLLRAEVVWLGEGGSAALPQDRRPLADFLLQLLKRAGEPFSDLEPDYADAGWVADRLTELLPFAVADKQRVLEMDDPLQRLETLYRELLAEDVSR